MIKNIRQCWKRQTNHDGSGASSTTRKNSEFLLFCLDSCLPFLLAAPLHCRSLLSRRASKSLLLIISPSLDTMLSWSPDVSNSWSSLAPITCVSCLPLNLPATQKINPPLHSSLQSGSVLETHVPFAIYFSAAEVPHTRIRMDWSKYVQENLERRLHLL